MKADRLAKAINRMRDVFPPWSVGVVVWDPDGEKIAVMGPKGAELTKSQAWRLQKAAVEVDAQFSATTPQFSEAFDMGIRDTYPAFVFEWRTDEESI